CPVDITGLDRVRVPGEQEIEIEDVARLGLRALGEGPDLLPNGSRRQVVVGLDDAETGGPPDVRPCSLKGVLRIGRVPGRELDLGVESGPAPDDAELPSPGRAGLLRLRQVRRLDTGKS